MSDIKSIHDSTSSAIKTISERTSDDQVAIFDPRVKFASKKEEQEAAIVWSTKSIELAIEAINDGQGLRVSPFLKNNPNLRKPNLLFQYTEEEIIEILRCKKDIVYFAETYVYLKTETGLKHIKLRSYQKKLLRSYQQNRWNITMFPRQAGKCYVENTKINIKIDNTIHTITIGDLYNLCNKSKHDFSLRNKIISYLWKCYDIVEQFKNKR